MNLNRKIKLWRIIALALVAIGIVQGIIGFHQSSPPLKLLLIAGTLSHLVGALASFMNYNRAWKSRYILQNEKPRNRFRGSL